MRKIFICLILIVVTFSFCSCLKIEEGINNPMYDQFYNQYADDENFWSSPMNDYVTNYVALKDINPKNIPEITLDFNVSNNDHILVNSGDGYLYVYSKTIAEEDRSPVVVKIDSTGNTIWEKEYTYPTISGSINNLLVFDDGSYLFSVNTWPHYSSSTMLTENSYIIKCDKNGNEEWKTDFENPSYNLLNKIFLTENNELLIIGNDNESDPNSYENIIITKLDLSGNILEQKNYGGSDFDSMTSACYNKNIGIIIRGNTQSKTGSFGRENEGDFIACVNESLNLLWVFQANEDDHFSNVTMDENSVYILGYQSLGVEGGNPNFLLQLDKDGNLIWRKDNIYESYWASCIAVNDNRIIVGANKYYEGILLFFDTEGNKLNQLNDLKYTPNSITLLDDNEFIISSSRPIKSVPQPAFVSSIWLDTETLVMKYDNAYKIVWRKTCDKYKEQIGTDYVWPQEDGTIVFEKNN